jgi:hypothetical protein
MAVLQWCRGESGSTRLGASLTFLTGGLQLLLAVHVKAFVDENRPCCFWWRKWIDKFGSSLPVLPHNATDLPPLMTTGANL